MPMPAVVVVIACKVAFLPYASELERENSAYTHYRPYEWATKHSQMQCRRTEIQLYNPAEPNASFTPQKCMRASFQVRLDWDRAHENSNWRVWKTACPVPIIDTRTGKVLAWKQPECPRENKQSRVTVHCDVDTQI